jgi:hypothetical protein
LVDGTKGFGGRASKTAGTNLENGVITYFNLKEFDKKKDTISLTYFNAKGDSLINYSTAPKDKKYKLKVKKGANKFVWNARGKGAEKLPGMILWWANLSGAKMVPGAYKVSLNVNGETQTQSFKILADPRAEVTVAQMQEQYDFVSDINATVAKAHNTIKSIRKLNAKFDAFVKQYGKNEATKNWWQKPKS